MCLRMPISPSIASAAVAGRRCHGRRAPNSRSSASQRHQGMLRVENLVEPLSEQVLLSRLSALPWPRPKRPLMYVVEQRITTADSPESYTQVCRKSELAIANPSKFI